MQDTSSEAVPADSVEQNIAMPPTESVSPERVPDICGSTNKPLPTNQDEKKKVHTPAKESLFKVVLEGSRGLENYGIMAGNASTAVSKIVRDRVSSLPMRENVRVWVQSKQRVYEHGVLRDYDNARRKGFTNRRVRTYKPVEPSVGVPSFSFPTDLGNAEALCSPGVTEKIQN